MSLTFPLTIDWEQLFYREIVRLGLLELLVTKHRLPSLCGKFLAFHSSLSSEPTLASVHSCSYCSWVFSESSILYLDPILDPCWSVQQISNSPDVLALPLVPREKCYWTLPLRTYLLFKSAHWGSVPRLLYLRYDFCVSCDTHLWPLLVSSGYPPAMTFCLFLDDPCYPSALFFCLFNYNPVCWIYSMLCFCLLSAIAIPSATKGCNLGVTCSKTHHPSLSAQVKT